MGTYQLWLHEEACYAKHTGKHYCVLEGVLRVLCQYANIIPAEHLLRHHLPYNEWKTHLLWIHAKVCHAKHIKKHYSQGV